ncbi:4Fe-4S dicluster domain-containing protein [bacterium]|nr:4Fe-4S dicluster domain-containing protein [bacterium]
MEKLKIIIPTIAIFVIVIIWSQSKVLFEVDSSKCIGCRQCEIVCPTDAIKIIGGKAIIDPAKCIGCGKCADVCPVNAISKYTTELAENTQDTTLDTMNADTVPVKDSTMQKTEVDSIDTIAPKDNANVDTSLVIISDSITVVDIKKCIGCGICIRACPKHAITIVDGKAVIDPEKCDFCGKCIKSCPFKAISIKKVDNK